MGTRNACSSPCGLRKCSGRLGVYSGDDRNAGSSNLARHPIEHTCSQSHIAPRRGQPKDLQFRTCKCEVDREGIVHVIAMSVSMTIFVALGNFVCAVPTRIVVNTKTNAIRPEREDISSLFSPMPLRLRRSLLHDLPALLKKHGSRHFRPSRSHCLSRNDVRLLKQVIRQTYAERRNRE